MKVYTHFKIIDNHIGNNGKPVEDSVRWRTLLQYGESWEIINDVASLADKINSAEIKIDANTTSIESAAKSVDDLNTRVQSAEEKITPEAITQTVRDSQGYKDDIASATMTSEKFETFVQNSQSISDMEMTAEKFETYVESKKHKI